MHGGASRARMNDGDSIKLFMKIISHVLGVWVVTYAVRVFVRGALGVAGFGKWNNNICMRVMMMITRTCEPRHQIRIELGTAAI